MKRFLILTLVIVLVLTFTGCTSDEIKLYNAMSNMQNVTSMESDTTFGLSFTAEGFSEEEQMKYQQISAMLNTLKMNMHQKTVQSKDKDLVKAEADAIIDFSGMAMDMKVWVDMDMSGDTPKFVEIIKMPQLIMSSMYPEDSSKEYIVYDIGKMLGETQDMDGFNELLKFLREIQPKINEYMKNSLEKFNPGFELVKYKEKRIVDGNELAIYEVKMDDAALKNLVRYTVNYAIDDEETKEFVKQYLDLVSKMAVVGPDEEEKLSQEDVEETLEKLNNELPELKDKFNSFMDLYQDVKIIGDEGIVLEYGVDSDGYVVHQSVNIPLEIKMEEFKKLADAKKTVETEEAVVTEEKAEPEDTIEPKEAVEAEEKAEQEEAIEENGVFKININYNTKIYNINGAIEINMPELNEENSVDITDIMKSENEASNDVNQPSDDLVQPSDDVVEPSNNVNEPSGENS